MCVQASMYMYMRMHVHVPSVDHARLVSSSLAPRSFQCMLLKKKRIES